MTLDLGDALRTFMTESRELLDAMEEALLRVEQAPGDDELVHSIFRAAHTIKGSAGIFGLDDIVAFTHVAESVLDRVRQGGLRFDGALASLFLSAGDHLRELLDDLSGRAVGPERASRGADLTARLAALLPAVSPSALEAGVGAGAGERQAASPLDGPTQADDDEGLAGGNQWHVSVRFGQQTFRDGFDPLSFLQALGRLGSVVHVCPLGGNVPPLSALVADECHLGFEISLVSDAEKATIEEVFDFVRDDSRVAILPPGSKLDDYRRLIEGLPESPLMLGEILLRCGTLTERELADALRAQARAREQSPESVPALGQILLEEGVVRPEVVDAALNKQRAAAGGAAGAEAATVRVDAAKLDRLIDLVGELVIASTGAELSARAHRVKAVVQANSHVARLVEEVRDSALTLRMVAIGATFNRFQRLVRDTSRELGKDIALEIQGAETELDKTVVERLADPLTHLVRNALDHGIGMPQVRIARGKPARGTLRLNAYHDAGSVVIEVADDGSGLKTERIEARAIERGLIRPDHGLSEHDLHQLIFEPGFSTAQQVSNLSGRGVGMDVVKRTIAALRGTIDLDSTEGIGTTVRIRLPLTLAIIDGFLVGVGRSSYVLPLDMVVECMELRGTAHAERSYLDLRGEVLPLVRLREVYGLGGEPGRRQNIVVVQGGGQRAALLVDQLQGELQTVIKPLGPVFQGVPGVGGFTILGNGSVALLLDVPGLVAQAEQQSHARHAEPRAGHAARATTHVATSTFH